MTRGPIPTLAARGISILGHPVVVTPLAGLVAWVAAGGAVTQVRGIVIAGTIAAMLVMGYSYRQVRSGAWTHVDASERGERRSLSRFLLVAFVVATIAGLALQWPPQVSLVLLLAALMVAATMLAARWCKPSLHLAFAVFSAGMLYVLSPWAVAGGLLAAWAIGWSRLYLGRHVVADLWCGALIGAAAGMVLSVGLRWPG